MSSEVDAWDEYKKDSRMPCKYGVKCYQKNSAHQRQYKHPPKNGKRKHGDKPDWSKKIKLDKEEKNSKEGTSNETDNHSSLEEKKECVSESPSESDDEKTELSVSSEVTHENRDTKKERVSESSSESDNEGKQVEKDEKRKPEASKKIKLDEEEKNSKEKTLNETDNHSSPEKKECVSESPSGSDDEKTELSDNPSKINHENRDKKEERVSESSSESENEEKQVEKNGKRKHKKMKLDEEDKISKEGTLSRERDNHSSLEKEKEHVSESSSESENEDKQDEKAENISHKPFDPKLFIKAKFLVEMPGDFYDFWQLCQELKPNNPSDAFKDVGLTLVGAYDVLAGKFKHVKKKPEEYLRHWRYYYDPPELCTVLKGDNNTGYHIGYFFDSPKEPPPFLVSNYGTKDGVLTKMGDNIFAAVSFYLEELKKIGDPFKKMHVGRLLASLKAKAEKLKLNLSSYTQQIRERDKKVVAKTFNKIGLVVPYNKKSQLGYRDLALADKELMTLLNKLDKAAPEQKAKYLSDLQPVFTYASIAIDECDFGTGVKLGWELLYHGIDSLNSTIIQFLSNSYKLLNKDAFAKIAEAHLSKRKKGSNLSIL